MTALTPAEIEFAAKLVTGVGGPLQSVSSAFFTADSSKWLAFGSVVEAMRERGWWLFMHDGNGHDEWIVKFVHGDFDMETSSAHDRDPNPAVAAIKAAFEALGGEAC